jgi:hypothetical protein
MEKPKETKSKRIKQTRKDGMNKIIIVLIMLVALMINSIKACSIVNFDKCGVCTSCTYWVFCGLSWPPGLARCTGDSSGIPYQDSASSPTGSYAVPLPDLCDAPVTLTGTCCGGAITTTTDDSPIIVDQFVGTCGGG